MSKQEDPIVIDDSEPPSPIPTRPPVNLPEAGLEEKPKGFWQNWRGARKEEKGLSTSDRERMARLAQGKKPPLLERPWVKGSAITVVVVLAVGLGFVAIRAGYAYVKTAYEARQTQTTPAPVLSPPPTATPAAPEARASAPPPQQQVEKPNAKPPAPPVPLTAQITDEQIAEIARRVAEQIKQPAAKPTPSRTAVATAAPMPAAAKPPTVQRRTTTASSRRVVVVSPLTPREQELLKLIKR